jgi:hypothetical protein
MLTEQEMFDLILNFARQDERARVAAMKCPIPSLTWG